jgi:hypothetical protein
MTSYIYGGTPSQIKMVEMEFVEEHDSIIFSIEDEQQTLSKRNIQIAVSLPKIFKKIEFMGLSSDEFDDCLYGIRHRYHIITKILSIYVKKFI